MKRRELLQLALAAPMARLPLSGASDKLASKARFRTAICAYSFRDALQNKRMTYEDLVRMAVEPGVDGLDFTVYWFPDKSDGFLLPLRRAAYRAGVEIYAISIRTDMCRPAGEQREKEITELRRWVDVAQKLGAGHIRIFGGDVPDGATEDQAAAWVVETLKRCSEYAGSQGIILGLENHGGITEQAKRVVEIVKQVDSPWVGINLDSGNFHADPYVQFETCVPFAVNVQIKSEIKIGDAKPGPADWPRLFGMLARGGYKGYVALEYEADPDPTTEVPKLIRRLRRLAGKYS